MIKISDLNIGQRIGLEVLWGLTWMISVMPYWVKFYLLEPCFYFLLCHLLRYRRKVIMENLRKSFPERSEKELRRIARRSYHNLAEVILGTFNLVHMPPRKVARYVRTEGLDEVNAAMQGQDFIVLLAHYGLWELGIYWNHAAPQHVCLSVYHQLRSKVLDLYYQRLRTHEFSVPVMKKEAMRFYLRNREAGIHGNRLVLGLIADQNPKHRDNHHWFDFLHQPTAFFDGAEQLALRFGMPVWYATFDRVGRGRYVIRFEQLYDGSEEVAPHEITERYVHRLERMICNDPAWWVWSHRRWKQKPTDVQN